MTTHNQVRLTTYASLAAVATTGLIAETKADLMIFDVGTTLTLQPVQGFGDPTGFLGSTFSYGLELTDLGQTMNFFGGRFSASNSTGSDFFRGTGWSLEFKGGSGGFAKNGKMARNFSAGQSVNSMNKFKSYVPGGVDKTKNFESKGTFSTNKGVMDGQAYIGFQVPTQGFGPDPLIFGWVDLTVGKDDDGKMTLTINRWAYESEVGAPAQVTSGNPVPGVGGLLGLAFGAAGIRGRRERVA